MEPREPSLVDVTVGERIRRRRLELGVGQEDLAAYLGITYQQLQKYENGKNRIAAGRLYETARFLKTNIAYFFDGLDPLHSVLRRGAGEEKARRLAEPDDQLVEMVLAVKQVRDPGARTMLIARVKKQAKAARKQPAKVRK